MNYQSFAQEINTISGKNCFRVADSTSLKYLETLSLPKSLVEFYKHYEPSEIIEINGIRLLPISGIKEENENYTPGYLLSPHGYCAIASTLFGDVYFLKTKGNEDQIVLASHDEIHEGQQIEELTKRLKTVAKSFAEFLNAFKAEGLPQSYYDVA